MEELINKFPRKKLFKKITEEFDCKVYEKTFFEETFSLLDFFKNIKKIGANVSNRSINLENYLNLENTVLKNQLRLIII